MSTKAKASLPPLSDWRVRYVAVAFGAPDDNQTVDGIPNPFDRQRCLARIDHEREHCRLARDATFKYFGSKQGRPDDIADPAARAEAKQFNAENDEFISSFAREALQYPALIRSDACLKNILLDPWFDDNEGVD